MLKSTLSKVLLMAIIAFAIASCSDQEIEPIVEEENIAFSSNSNKLQSFKVLLSENVGNNDRGTVEFDLPSGKKLVFSAVGGAGISGRGIKTYIVGNPNNRAIVFDQNLPFSAVDFVKSGLSAFEGKFGRKNVVYVVSSTTGQFIALEFDSGDGIRDGFKGSVSGVNPSSIVFHCFRRSDRGQVYLGINRHKILVYARNLTDEFKPIPMRLRRGNSWVTQDGRTMIQTRGIKSVEATCDKKIKVTMGKKVILLEAEGGVTRRNIHLTGLGISGREKFTGPFFYKE